jgi:hypothetical protein
MTVNIPGPRIIAVHTGMVKAGQVVPYAVGPLRSFLAEPLERHQLGQDCGRSDASHAAR